MAARHPRANLLIGLTIVAAALVDCGGSSGGTKSSDGGGQAGESGEASQGGDAGSAGLAAGEAGTAGEDDPEPTDCSTDKDCSGSTGRCDGERGLCVACLTGADCASDERCVAGDCLPSDSCQNSRDCATGMVCSSAKICVECAADADCEEGMSCVGNACRDACTSDRACVAMGLLCDRNRGTCVDCLEDEDCGTSLGCIDGVCRGGQTGAGGSGNAGSGAGGEAQQAGTGQGGEGLGGAGGPGSGGSSSGGSGVGGSDVGGNSSGGVPVEPCGSCNAGEICIEAEGRCVDSHVIDDFGSCDDEICPIEGRSGLWYFYRSGVSCDYTSCEGIGTPVYVSDGACGAWSVGGAEEILTGYYAGFGLQIADGAEYNACAYTGIQVTYASSEPVDMFLKYAGTGDTAPRVGASLPGTVDVITETLSLSDSTVCSQLTEIQFEPTSLYGWGFAIYDVRFVGGTVTPCTSGQTRCSGESILETCSDGVWTQQSCSGSTVCRSGDCVEDVPMTPVTAHGHLSVSGTQLVDQQGDPVQLRGVSSHWLNWEADGYAESSQALVSMRDQWNLSVIRAAMGVEPEGAYLEDPTKALSQVDTIVSNAVAAGVYVIIDWHCHTLLSTDAVTFFRQMSAAYGHLPNVIFEVFNEPLELSWSSTLVPYHETVLSAIRAADPDQYPNVVVLGTPNWDQDVDVAAMDMLSGQTNIMYTLHFYACTHQAELRARAADALAYGLPIFVTEWGATDADGGTDGVVCEDETEAWHTWMNANDISWAAWKLDDCDEEIAERGTPDSSCLLALNAPLTGGWTSADLNGHGSLVFDLMSR